MRVRVATPVHVSATTVNRSVGNGCNPRQPRRVPDTPWGRMRAQRGWSIRELADRTGINRGDLSKFEHGRGCPTPVQAARLLHAYGVEL